MTPPRTVVLDNEAVQALRSINHAKHHHALAHVQVVADRKRKAATIDVVVPAAVRVESGWDRHDATAAFINHLRISDRPLDTDAANAAASIRARDGASVTEAHIGAVIAALASQGPITVITSDPNDMSNVAQPVAVTIVTL